MKVLLPIQTKEFKDGKIERHSYNKEFELDPSLASEMRWEAKFPQQAEHEDLFTYTQRIQKIEELTAPVIISKMKSIYCWFDTDISFIDFLKLFDLSDVEYINKLTSTLTEIWQAIKNGSAEKNY